MTPRNLLLAGAFALAAGCADPPDNSTDFQYLHATIIEPRCATAGCHSYATSHDFPLSLSGPIDLSEPHAAYQSLTSVGCAVSIPGVSCTAPPEPDHPNGWLCSQSPSGEPDLLRLFHGTYGQGADFNIGYTQMPADFPLTSAEIDAIAHWIDAGAPCTE